MKKHFVQVQPKCDIAATSQVRPICDIALGRRSDVAFAISPRHRRCDLYAISRWDVAATSPVRPLCDIAVRRCSDIAGATSPRHRRCDLCAISRCDVAAMSKSATILGSQRCRCDFDQSRGDIAATQVRHEISYWVYSIFIFSYLV